MPKPFYPAAATAVLLAAMFSLYVSGCGGDISALVCVDRGAIGQPPYEAVRIVPASAVTDQLKPGLQGMSTS